MNNIIKQLKRGAKNTRLSSAEKGDMRSVLLQYVKSHPVDQTVFASRAIPSPYIFSKFRNKKTISAFVIGSLLVGSSVSFAAEGSVPGDILYPVKVGVNENVRRVVAVTPEAKAALDVALVERRLVEIEKLAALPDTPAELHELAAVNLGKYMHAAEERFETVENDNDGDEDTHIVTNLSAVLSVHEQILSDIQADFEKKNITVPRHDEDASERRDETTATSSVSTATTTSQEVKKESERHEDSPKKMKKEEHSFAPATTTATTTTTTVATTTASVAHSEHIKKALETVRESIKEIEVKNEEYKKKNKDEAISTSTVVVTHQETKTAEPKQKSEKKSSRSSKDTTTATSTPIVIPEKSHSDRNNAVIETHHDRTSATSTRKTEAPKEVETHSETNRTSTSTEERHRKEDSHSETQNTATTTSEHN
ncbi:MAG: hypothetical protein WC791_03455 [Candidatus Paceibacterota bacterium]|jgi:hypothetical protein